jgi:hypothetical protein
MLTKLATPIHLGTGIFEIALSGDGSFLLKLHLKYWLSVPGNHACMQ